jgi:hypothetical protein
LEPRDRLIAASFGDRGAKAGIAMSTVSPSVKLGVRALSLELADSGHAAARDHREFHGEPKL